MTRMARQQLATYRGGIAAVLGPALRTAFEGELPVRVRAWDGSETGREGPPVLVVRYKAALRHLLWHPGELGLAQALYLAGAALALEKGRMSVHHILATRPAT